jgi:hypothetical protein
VQPIIVASRTQKQISADGNIFLQTFAAIKTILSIEVEFCCGIFIDEPEMVFKTDGGDGGDIGSLLPFTAISFRSYSFCLFLFFQLRCYSKRLWPTFWSARWSGFRLSKSPKCFRLSIPSDAKFIFELSPRRLRAAMCESTERW